MPFFCLSLKLYPYIQIACRKLYLRVILMEPSFNCFIFIVFTLITQKKVYLNDKSLIGNIVEVLFNGI